MIKSLIAAVFILFASHQANAVEGVTVGSEEDGFTIEFPAKPESISRTDKDQITQELYSKILDNHYYVLAVTKLPQQADPPLDMNDFKRLLEEYADSTETQVRASSETVVGGRKGIAAVTRNARLNEYHVIEITGTGDRIYVLGVIGQNGVQNTKATKHFLETFHILDAR